MKISVVVPVYNSEKYISYCVKSVISQTYENWELILVDDGSTDNSLEILKDLAKKDSRIYLIHQENAGPGRARNVGIFHASGEYIVFLDSDDRINKDYLSLLSQKNEDVVFIDVNQTDEKFHILKKEYMSSFKNLSKDALLRQQMTGKINWGGVRKAVKRKLLLNNMIEFSEHKIGEEAIYSFLVLWNAKSFSFIDKAVYTYVNHAGSQSSTQMDDPWGNVALSLKKRIIEMDLYSNYGNTLNSFIITAAVISLARMALRYDYCLYRKLAKNRIQKLQKDIDSRCSIDFCSVDKKVFFLYPFLKGGWITPIFIISRLRRICGKINIFYIKKMSKNLW